MVEQMSNQTPADKIRWAKDRLPIWQEDCCPYCKRKNIVMDEITKKTRDRKRPMRGVKYSCLDCGAVNSFTRGVWVK